MRLLLDTHLLLWASFEPMRLTPQVKNLLSDLTNELLFSVASIWEIAIKTSLGRQNFDFDSALLRRGLLDRGYIELPITGLHAVTVATLPPLHKDPFDRILVAQSIAESILLLTSDAAVARYPGPIQQA